MKEIVLAFYIGQIVYLKTDLEQEKYFVTGIEIRQTGVKYFISSKGYESAVYDFELTKDQNVLVKLGID
ncbi:hypothetical protein [Lutibacter maritimus]|uniref:Uncharacterized protein n=1 Tax=Lutibacter maritimus TaxID=593133 RepID=A0A1I6NS67_9FLAO|nr:hypothetical protein [Lutibacter maritimus]SFS30715.1 hypothetical protein SAMN04488006_0475 [Lutibacter maritimus]